MIYLATGSGDNFADQEHTFLDSFREFWYCFTLFEKKDLGISFRKYIVKNFVYILICLIKVRIVIINMSMN